MSILADRDTTLIVQGITGREGSYHTAQMLSYGTRVVGGVTPGKGGEWVHGKPVFDSVVAAVEATGANATIIFVSAASATDAIYEAIDAGVPLIICVTEGIPVLDMLKVHTHLKKERGIWLIGPNSPGILAPGRTKVGIIPSFIGREGSVGVISRSGSLINDVVYHMSQRGIGQSTIVGIGGDPNVGMSFVDGLELFEDDPETNRVVLIGEIGGRMEIDAANFIQSRMTKPVYACVVGGSAPRRTRMGHAGAIVIEDETAAAVKIEALRAAGAIVADDPDQLLEMID